MREKMGELQGYDFGKGQHRNPNEVDASSLQESATESDSGTHLTSLPISYDSSIISPLGDGDTGANRSQEVKPFSKSPGNDSLDTEISNRISNVYKGIQKLEKKKAHFDSSIRSATRNSFRESSNLKAITPLKLPSTSRQEDSTPEPADTPSTESSDPRNMTGPRVDVTRQYPKMFGLDPMKVIQSSSDSSDSEDGDHLLPHNHDPNRQQSLTAKTSRKKKTRVWRKELEKYIQQEPPRDMSAIMPTLSEKNFLSKLHRREKQLNKEISDMRNHLDVMNLKSEHEARKAQASSSGGALIKPSTRVPAKVSLSRILAGGDGGGDKGPSRDLMDFLQATGGSTGGWQVEDHQVFLRLCNKNSDRPTPAKLKVLTAALPGKPIEEIAEHLKWLERYEELNEANKSHIREWQLKKKAERELAFQKISEASKQKTQVEKRNQEMLQRKREEERGRNMEKLAIWKMAKAKNRKSSMLENDLEMNTSERIQKMDMDLLNVKKEIREISALTKDMGRSFSSLSKLDATFSKPLPGGTSRSRRERAQTGSSEASSGFCDMSIDEIESLGKEIVGDGKQFLKNSSPLKASTTSKSKSLGNLGSISRDAFETQISKKLLQDFRLRDLEIIEAKRKSILERKERMRNPAFLSDQQLKDRIKGNSAPSKVLNPTKGWTIRKEIVDLEKIENINRADENIPRSRSFVDRLNQPVTVNHIPKLGTPAWRKSSIS